MLCVGVTRQRLWGSGYSDNCSRDWSKEEKEDESKPVMTLEELCGWAKDKLAPYKVVSFLLIRKLDQAHPTK